MLERSVDLPGIRNARELGGIKIGHSTIRKGLLIRTAKLNDATPEALERLHNIYNVRTVIDFRMTIEQKTSADPEIEGAKNVFLPVIEIEDTLKRGDPKIVKMFKEGRITLDDRMKLFDLSYDNGMLTNDLYESFLLPSHGIQAFRQFFKALLSLEKDCAILWHCADGKDRTGCAAMLLLYALGADYDTVMQDYLLTNAYNAEMIAAIRQKMAPANMPEEKLNALLFMSCSVNASYMDKAIKALNREYGSVLDYITGALNISEDEIKSLKEKFLD